MIQSALRLTTTLPIETYPKLPVRNSRRVTQYQYSPPHVLLTKNKNPYTKSYEENTDLLCI